MVAVPISPSSASSSLSSVGAMGSGAALTMGRERIFTRLLRMLEEGKVREKETKATLQRRQHLAASYGRMRFTAIAMLRDRVEQH